MSSKNGQKVLTSVSNSRNVTIGGDEKRWLRHGSAKDMDSLLSPAVANLSAYVRNPLGKVEEGVQEAVPHPEKPRYLLVKHEYKTIKILIEDILFFQGKGNYVAIHTRQQVIVALLTMSKLEQLLAPYGFLRAHKSFIVSFGHIDAIWNDKIQIQNKLIPIGGQYRDKFLDVLNKNCVIVNGGLLPES